MKRRKKLRGQPRPAIPGMIAWANRVLAQVKPDLFGKALGEFAYEAVNQPGDAGPFTVDDVDDAIRRDAEMREKARNG